MSISVGDVVRLVMFTNLPGAVQQQNVFHMFMDSGTSVGEGVFMDDVASFFSSNALQTLKQIIDSEATFDYLLFYLLDGNGAIDRIIGTRPLGVGGAQAQEMLPHMDAALTTSINDMGQIKGRKYYSGVVETQHSQGILNSAALTSLATYAGKFLPKLSVTGGHTFQWGVWSTPANAFRSTDGSARVTNLLATQRRRRIGRGS